MSGKVIHHLCAAGFVVVVIVTLPAAVMGWFTTFRPWFAIMSIVLILGGIWGRANGMSEYGHDTQQGINPWWKDGEEDGNSE